MGECSGQTGAALFSFGDSSLSTSPPPPWFLFFCFFLDLREHGLPNIALTTTTATTARDLTASNRSDQSSINVSIVIIRSNYFLPMVNLVAIFFSHLRTLTHLLSPFTVFDSGYRRGRKLAESIYKPRSALIPILALSLSLFKAISCAA